MVKPLQGHGASDETERRYQKRSQTTMRCQARKLEAARVVYATRDCEFYEMPTEVKMMAIAANLKTAYDRGPRSGAPRRARSSTNTRKNRGRPRKGTR